MRAMPHFTLPLTTLTWQCPRCCSMDGDTTTMLPRHVTVNRKPLIKFSNASVVGWLILNWHVSLVLPNTEIGTKYNYSSILLRRNWERETWDMITKFRKKRSSAGKTYRNWCVRCAPKNVAPPFCQRVVVNRPHAAPSTIIPESIHSIYHVDSFRHDFWLHDHCYYNFTVRKRKKKKTIIIFWGVSIRATCISHVGE